MTRGDAPKLPPSFPEGERAILGGILLDNRFLPDVILELSDHDFYYEQNRLIFQAMVELYESNRPVDWVTVTDKLKTKGKLDGVGGPGFLAQLADAVPSAANWRHYAEKVSEKSFLRNTLWSLSEIVDECYSGQTRKTTICDKLQDIAFKQTRATQRHDPVSIDRCLAEFENVYENGGEEVFPTGVSTIDDYIGGFVMGDFFGIAARPSAGKTALAGNITRHVALSIPVVWFSLEMQRSQLVLRNVASIAGIDIKRLRLGPLSPQDMERIRYAKGKLRELDLHIDDTPALTTGQMRSKLKQIMSHWGWEKVLVFVDHLGLVAPTNQKQERVRQLGQVSMDLKNMAKELKVCICALIQLNRNIDYRPLANMGRLPRLNDLRDSGEIEQALDVCLGLYNPNIYAPEMSDEEKARCLNIALVNVMKQRNGPTGIAKLAWQSATATFSARTDDQSAYSLDHV